MMTMRKIFAASVCLMVSIMTAQAQTPENKEINRNGVLRADTIYRTDTIHIKEVITRTDIVHRTEKVVRYYGDSSVEKIESEIVESNNPSGGVNLTETIVVDNVKSDDAELLFPNAPSGGKFVWIPDSLEDDVKTLIAGGAPTADVKIKEEEKKIDLNEKVSFRGDTINMILKDRNLGRFDRGLFNYLFIPKGIWQVGLTASYGEFSTADLQVLDLISDIDFNGKLWSIRPYFQYFFKSNLSVGLRLGYTQGRANIGSFKVDIDEDMNFNLHDIMYKSNNYSASVTFSQYLGIARKGRFGVFNEVELALSGGDSDFHRPFNGEMRRTHTTSFQAALNFSPGVCVYVLDQVSFNVSLGVFGLNLKHEKQKVNDEELGSRTTSGANFRFNIFNINFGIAVNI